MKRLTFLLALSALVVGCTSRIPAGFQPLSSGKGGNGFNGETLDTRPTGYDAMALAIRNGTIPPEAILATVYFDFDRYNVSAAERGKLDAAAARIKGTKVIIAGYTDTFGTEEYNLGLSDRRAQSVRDYLVGLGANQANSEIMALGSQQADKSAAGRQSGAKDRKALVVDVNYGGAAAANRPSAAPAPAAGAAPAPVSDLSPL
ncbi:MAG: peptidoglycan-associated lipoprotein Pal [Verrucomicrobiota bacterium]|jgi:peptidoglycan-associated lipoprotein